MRLLGPIESLITLKAIYKAISLLMSSCKLCGVMKSMSDFVVNLWKASGICTQSRRRTPKSMTQSVTTSETYESSDDAVSEPSRRRSCGSVQYR
jgi:hypothetical protein